MKKSELLRRLFRYVLLYKGRVGLALFILLVSVGAQLGGPYIAKIIIDQHIVGIQKQWYQMNVAEVPRHVDSVEFNGNAYVREDWLKKAAISPNPAWKEAKISQVEQSFYLIPQKIDFNGNWKLMAPDRIEITLNHQNAIYPAIRLTASEVKDFYQFDFIPTLILIGFYVLLLIVASALTFLQSYLLQSTALHIIQQMRMDVMNHIQSIPIRYFDNTPIGQVVSRIANDTEAIKELFMSLMATFVVSGINIIGIVIALFILDYRLALVTLIIIPLFAVIMWVHLKYSKVYIKIMRARLAEMNAMINEMIVVMPIIQIFRKEKESLAEFEVLNNDRYVNSVKQFRIYGLSARNMVGFIGGLVTAVVVWYFGGLSLHSAISLGVFYAFIDYLGRFYQPFIGIFDQLTNAQRAFVSAERVFNLMDEEAEYAKPQAKDTLALRPEGNVKFERVSFAYKDEQFVLRDITFDAKKGETIALVGHTGSGKSSIMNLLLGFYEPNKGVISIDGRDIANFSKQDLRKYMGIVLQDPFLFAGDIEFNVSLYNQTVGTEGVLQALRDVDAASFVELLPKGVNEPVFERGSTLSAGQRQLISFARALVFNPAILILDEATASIDSETESLIQKALKVLSQGRTTFIIAHRLSTIREADQILVLHRGEVVERGNHEELMILQGRYYTMYQLQKGDLLAG